MFICAGYNLMARSHNQDLRGLRSQTKKLVVDIRLLVSVLKLKGLVYLTGFFSKDRIIDFLIGTRNFLVSSVFVFSLFLTTLYSFRMLGLMCVFEQAVTYMSSRSVSLVPLILTGVSLVFGWYTRNLFISLRWTRLSFKVLLYTLLGLGLVRLG